MKYILKIVKNIIKNIPRYSQKKLLLGFEYGVTLSDTMKGMNQELTPEIVSRAEDIIIKEFSQKNPERLAVEMIPNLMASIEPK